MISLLGLCLLSCRTTSLMTLFPSFVWRCSAGERFCEYERTLVVCVGSHKNAMTSPAASDASAA